MGGRGYARGWEGTDLGESDGVGTLPEALPANVEAVLKTRGMRIGRAAVLSRGSEERTLRMRPAGWVQTRLLRGDHGG